MGIVISTHFPPPVMIDSTADRSGSPTCCAGAGPCTFRPPTSSENDQGSMNLDSNTASVPSTIPSRVATIQGMAECLTRRWTLVMRWPVLRSYQVAVELLGCDPELHDQVAGQVLRLGLPALLAPKPNQGGFIVSHDDPGIGAADEGSPDLVRPYNLLRCHVSSSPTRI